jgi:sugar phosphate isomerase/epimerase
MVSNHFATITNPGHAADRDNTFRGVLWADVISEFLIAGPRRYEFFHVRDRVTYPDFRFHEPELDGIHRAWSDGSVEWTVGSRLNLSGASSLDLRVRHIFGNFYF